MFICDLYQAYLDDDTDELPFPCENCAAWIEKTDTCLCEEQYNEEQEKLNALNVVQTLYTAVKVVHTVKTTAKPGYDIPALIKSEFAELYATDRFLKTLDLNDLDAVLDYLHGVYNLFGNAEYKELIDFIEDRCEVKK